MSDTQELAECNRRQFNRINLLKQDNAALMAAIEQKNARIDELLAANNEYQQRYRDAEAKLARVRRSDSRQLVDPWDEPFFGDA